jgi:hypothetical protein
LIYSVCHNFRIYGRIPQWGSCVFSFSNGRYNTNGRLFYIHTFRNSMFWTLCGFMRIYVDLYRYQYYITINIYLYCCEGGIRTAENETIENTTI